MRPRTLKKVSWTLRVAWVTRLELGHDDFIKHTNLNMHQNNHEYESNSANFYKFLSILSWNQENCEFQAASESLSSKWPPFLKASKYQSA